MRSWTQVYSGKNQRVDGVAQLDQRNRQPIVAVLRTGCGIQRAVPGPDFHMSQNLHVSLLSALYRVQIGQIKGTKYGIHFVAVTAVETFCFVPEGRDAVTKNIPVFLFCFVFRASCNSIIPLHRPSSKRQRHPFTNV